MKCRHCKQDVPSIEVRCPHCGTAIRLNPLSRLLRGWGIVDLLLLAIAACGVAALVYMYLLNTIIESKELWHVESQAYEEIVGQVKIVGIVKNMSSKKYEGSLILELRVFDSSNTIVYQEYGTTADQTIESDAEIPFSFVIQRPSDMAFFNVIAKKNQ